MSHALFDGLAGAEHHRGGRAQADLVTGTMYVDPVVDRRFQAADAMAHRVVENFRAAAGQGIETRVAQPRERVIQREIADFGDVDNFGRGETVAPDGVSRLNRAQQVFVPFDLEFWVQTALHQDSRAAQIKRLLNLLEDHFAGVQVTFGVPHWTIKRAKAAIFGAEIGVINIAIDNVTDPAFRMQLAAHGVGLHADGNQVVTVVKFDGLSPGNHAGTPFSVRPAATVTRSSAAACFRYSSMPS